MISDQDWQKLKVGDVIYIAYDPFRVENIEIITTSIKKITKKQIKLNKVNRFHHECFNSSFDRLFLSKTDAINKAIEILKTENDVLLKKAKNLNNRIKQLEQENGK